MNNKTRVRRIFSFFVAFLLVSWFALAPQQGRAQDPGSPAASEKFSREELAQMLGPIALYPDKLLSQVLMASTYPIEVIEADRWVKKHAQLQGDTLDRALLEKDWDPSVKSICHFPAILALMGERISETTNLGNAFLVQEAEVMDMVQELRAKAHAQGNLTSTSQQKVVVEKETIIIEPANPRVIYVPYYDPYYVYGPWWYPAYPPYYWGPPGISPGVRLSFWPGIYFGFSWGSWSYFDWPHRHIYIHAHDRPRYVRHDHWHSKPGRWAHAPAHRRGVAYLDKFTATKYGHYPQRAGDFRSDTRGFSERRDLARERSRSGDERTIDRERRRYVPSHYERGRQEQQRVERELQQRQRQLREPTARNRHPRQERPEIDRVPQRQERVQPPRQEQPRIDRAPRERERVEQDRPLRQRTDQRSQPRQSVEREQPQRNREKVFEQRQDGRSERQSSGRGRFSRQERNHDSRDRGRPSGGTRVDREDGGRSRR